MPKHDQTIAGLEALTRLIEIAQKDTGQSRRVADFLLAWHNAAENGGWDVTNEAEQGSCLTRRFAEGRDEFPVNGRAQHSFEVSDSDDGLQI